MLATRENSFEPRYRFYFSSVCFIFPDIASNVNEIPRVSPFNVTWPLRQANGDSPYSYDRYRGNLFSRLDTERKRKKRKKERKKIRPDATLKKYRCNSTRCSIHCRYITYTRGSTDLLFSPSISSSHGISARCSETKQYPTSRGRRTRRRIPIMIFGFAMKYRC